MAASSELVQQYNSSQHSNIKSSKSNQGNPAGGCLINSSRNAKIVTSNQAIKSNSQVAAAGNGGGTVESSLAYKSSGNVPSSQTGSGSKVFKVPGYEDSKGINERFIDLNKVSEGAPKISKPTLAAQVVKSSEFNKSQGVRLGDQSAKAQSIGINLLGSMNNVQA